MVKIIVLPWRHEIVMICNAMQVRLNRRGKMRSTNSYMSNVSSSSNFQ